MNRYLRQVFAVLMAVLVVAQPFTPMIGVAVAADSDDDSCSGLDGAVYVLSIGHFSKECAVQEQVSDAVTSVKQAQDNQTRTDLYSASIAQDAATDPFLATMRNSLVNSKSVAWMEAEVVLAQAYENGTSLAVARSQAKTAVEDYYSVQQRNILAQWKAEVAALKAMNQRAEFEGLKALSDDGTGTYEVGWPEPENDGKRMYEFAVLDYKGDDPTYGASAYFKSFKNVSVTLANGTKVTVPAICYHVSESRSGGTDETDVCYYPGSSNVTVTGDGYGWTIRQVVGVYVSGDFDSSMNAEMIIDFRTYEKLWDKTNTYSTDVENKVDTYSNQTYEAFQKDKIQPRDVVSKVTAITRYGTTDNGTDMYDVVAALGKMGLAAPDLNSTGTMNVTDVSSGTTYTGIVLAEQAPGGAWQAGKTYNASNISGPVWVATTDGESHKLTGKFTIDAIYNKSGEKVSNVSTTTYVYRTSNVSKYAKLLEKISDLRGELESREPDYGGVTGSGSGLPVSKRTLMLIGGGLAAVFVLGKALQGRQGGG